MDLTRRLSRIFRKSPSGVLRHQSREHKARSRILRWLLIGAQIVVLTASFPQRKTHELEEGRIAAEKIVAPFDFRVFKNDKEYEEDKRKEQRAVAPVFYFDEEMGKRQIGALDSLFKDVQRIKEEETIFAEKIDQLWNKHPIIPKDVIGFLLSSRETDAIKKVCREVLKDNYSVGIVRDKKVVESQVFPESKRRISLFKGGKEQMLPADELKDITKVREDIKEIVENRIENKETANMCVALTSSLITENIKFNKDETERRRNEAAGGVAPVKDQYIKKQVIIDANEKVTSDHVDVLNSMQKKLSLTQAEYPWKRTLTIGAKGIVCSLIIFLFLIYLYMFRRSIYDKVSHLLLLTIVLVFPVLIASWAASTPEITWSLPFYGPIQINAQFLVPVALSAMLATILFDAEVGLVFTFAISLLSGIILNYDLQATFVFALSGGVAAYSVRNVRHRQSFYRSIIYLVLIYGATIAATDVLRFGPSERILEDILPGALVGFFSPVLAMGLLPIFESIFNITTDITLLELSDLNRPLLRELALRAPGTYTHSVIMANLSEAASEAIGENPLLARVGCYYHDIGKMKNSEYFIENQVGMRNPHDKLSPSMSALIIVSHVKDGQEMAEENGLPKAIIDIILQHHGMTLAVYFYDRAIQREGKDDVSAQDFRYEGPRPQTKVAGIIMLADAIEATTRVLKDKAPGRVKGVVRDTIKERFSESELDECDLTLKDLTAIEGGFMHILAGALHERIEYPKKASA